MASIHKTEARSRQRRSQSPGAFILALEPGNSWASATIGKSIEAELHDNERIRHQKKLQAIGCEAVGSPLRYSRCRRERRVSTLSFLRVGATAEPPPPTASSTRRDPARPRERRTARR